MSWELNTCPRDSKQGGIQQRDIKKERKAICLPLFFLVPQNSFTGLRETSPVLSTMLAPTWVLACFSGQGQQHLSCEEMFSLQYVCLTELCPTAPGLGPQSTGLLGSPAGGWGARVGWSNRTFVLATCCWKSQVPLGRLWDGGEESRQRGEERQTILPGDSRFSRRLPSCGRPDPMFFAYSPRPGFWKVSLWACLSLSGVIFALGTL